ncbi:acyl-CoA synthetase (NDP forming) [Bradyrhizobium sp. I1.7.5]
MRIVNEMAGRASKPVIYISAMSIGLPNSPRGLRKSLPHLTVMRGMDRAVTAIKSLLSYAKLRKAVPDIVSSSKPAARALLEEVLESFSGVALDEVASKNLQAYGIPISSEAIAQTAKETANFAEQISFPVVAKAMSAEILHKSDNGSVLLNLNSAAEVKTAFAEITERVEKLRSRPTLSGILSSRSRSRPRSSSWSALRSTPRWAGGAIRHRRIDFELVKDVALAGAPLDEAEARQLIGRTKAGMRLSGASQFCTRLGSEGAGRPAQFDC